MAAPTLPGAALVTGAPKRLGRAIADMLVARGYALALHHRNSDDDAEAFAAEIRAQGGKAHVLRADLGIDAEVTPMIGEAEQALGLPVTVLVNNASLFERDEWDTVTRESWDDHLNANLFAPMLLSQALARALPADRAGVIINLIDQRVWNLTPHFVSYTVSKTGLWSLTQSLAMALAPRIRVAAIGPGPTLPSPRQSQAAFEAQWRATPLERPVDPAEIAAAAAFILDTPSFTGQMIALDSGQHLGWRSAAAGANPADEE
ncbi:MAG: SDR family oxidoreductase [Magnetovibrionaceae bacterium]